MIKKGIIFKNKKYTKKINVNSAKIIKIKLIFINKSKDIIISINLLVSPIIRSHRT